MRTFTHPSLCVSFTEHPLYLDLGLYIQPTVIQISPMGCPDSYVSRLQNLIEIVRDPTVDLPHSQLVSRPKRFALTGAAFVAGIAALIATIGAGTGLSNRIDLEELTDTVGYIKENQEKITFELNQLTQSVMEMNTVHHNRFMAMKQTVDLAKAQSDFNACQIGLNHLDSTIQSIMAQTLTSFILPPHNVMTFLKSNKILADSIYVRFPRLVYKLGKVELVDVNPTEKTYTVLVILPHINYAPEGFLYEPLFAPRFFPLSNNSQIEEIPEIPPLFSYSGPFDKPHSRTDLLSMDITRCGFYPSAVICPLSAQFYRPSTTCSNLLINNITDVATLAKACDITSHSAAPRHLTVFDESTTSLLLFTNEVVVGQSSAGQVEIVPVHAPPSCVLINKLQLSSLEIGGRVIFLNLRADAFNLAPPDRYVIRHVHALDHSLPFADSRKLRSVPQLHPKSRHFLPSLATVIATTIAVLVAGVILAFLIVKVKRYLYYRFVGDVQLQNQIQRLDLPASAALPPPYNPMPV